MTQTASCDVVAEGVTDSAAAKSYKSKKTPPVPTSRYGATSIAYQNQLWLYAGTDGGFSKHGNGGYEQGVSTETFCCQWLFQATSSTPGRAIHESCSM